MADPRKTPWLVLGLDPSWFTSASYSSSDNSSTSPADQATRAALVRRAYRRALLQHHPDKQMRAGSGASSAASNFTVDDIKAAYIALGGDSASGNTAPTAGTLESASAALEPTATGLEIVDLDELPYDEAMQTWYRTCRCGNPRGYTFGERDLEEELDAEAMEELLVGNQGTKAATTTIPAGELLVGCQDCSLWLCVHFAVAPDGGEDDDDDDEMGEED
ncbi:Diphthamide biosynthesis protein 4 [Sporothrix stenoceras]|uniref:Diphthamide biosynthesis protein 4 n=1 Tax=Sporothrix stenoceras TaxID=5173 RepID=A0ABR3Z1D0_9PEZI